MKNKITLNYPKSAQLLDFPNLKGLNNEFETAKVNEPSVFEPLMFYCTKKSISVTLTLESVIREAAALHKLITVDSRYPEIEGTLKNSLRYPYFDISDL